MKILNEKWTWRFAQYKKFGLIWTEFIRTIKHDKSSKADGFERSNLCKGESRKRGLYLVYIAVTVNCNDFCYQIHTRVKDFHCAFWADVVAIDNFSNLIYLTGQQKLFCPLQNKKGRNAEL